MKYLINIGNNQCLVVFIFSNNCWVGQFKKIKFIKLGSKLQSFYCQIINQLWFFLILIL
jgi:hypothetical protein